MVGKHELLLLASLWLLSGIWIHAFCFAAGIIKGWLRLVWLPIARNIWPNLATPNNAIFVC